MALAAGAKDWFILFHVAGLLQLNSPFEFNAHGFKATQTLGEHTIFYLISVKSDLLLKEIGN